MTTEPTSAPTSESTSTSAASSSEPEETAPPTTPVKPSAGCGKGGGTPTIAHSLVTTPSGYDGTKPVPVVIAFHPAGNKNDSLKNFFGNSEITTQFLMVYPGAEGNGWSMNTDKARFEAAYKDTLEKACVDENRVYAMGHSSGAQFIVQLLCAGETRFRAVAPVASSVYCNKWQAVPALVIHGVRDEERQKYGLNDGDGKKDIVPYVTSNGCEMATQPSSIDVGNSCSSSIHPGCVDYQGCETPVTWCNHDDPNYGTTNHGVPCFAKSAILEFFTTH